MRSVYLLFIILSLSSPVAPLNYGALEKLGETSYAEKSYAQAHEFYEQASKLDLTAVQKRWVTMRLADTAWRAEKSKGPEALDEFIRASRDEHDRAWAEANESLGDFWWTNPNRQNFEAARPWYLAALDWWAESSDIALARRRYLDIVFRMTETSERYWMGYSFTSTIPTEIFVNAVAIAETPEDRAHARYLLGSRLLADSKPESVERGLELLDQIIREGRASQWYDDALFDTANRMKNGTVEIDENGDPTFKPDYNKALELFRRLVSEFQQGQSRYWQPAKNSIDEISQPTASVSVAGTFLPQSEQQVIVSWRNLARVELTITAVDLMTDVPASNGNPYMWPNAMRTDGHPVLRRWTYETNDRGDHVPGNHPIRLTPKLEPGAYIIEALGGLHNARQLLLVTDANIVAHIAGGRSDLFVCDAVTGRPIAGARVRAWQLKDYNARELISRDGQTDSSGVATLTSQGVAGGPVFVAASTPNGRQAWITTQNYGYWVRNATEWHIYAFTDRPAYRPGEKVQWKIIARTRDDNGWITPANETISYEINSPRGEKLSAGTATLNAFGSFWSELSLTDSMPLGQYYVVFRRKDPKNNMVQIGSAALFRLEEYKLPEFRVAVTTPEAGGKKKQYRLGDTVEATIEATYYFGGPVANAEVEAVVFSQPVVHYWAPWREYPWYYENQNYAYGRQQIKTETLKTDSTGHATIHVETEQEDPDTQFTIEARVTDASRREVIGQGSVRVTKQRYSVIAHPEHFLLRPGDRAAVDFKAIDANDEPVQTTGTVKVLRYRWEQTWISPAGRESSTLPRDSSGWRRKFLGYREQEVTTQTVTTDAKGEATVTISAPREGYYVIRWASEDRDPGRKMRARDRVTAETSIWVTDAATLDIGYHSGLDIIVDKESFRSGQTAAAMIVTPASGRWLMLTTTSSHSIIDTQVLHLDGTVKLVQIPLDDRHTPAFSITASSVADRLLATANKTIVVPPVEHFINVDVKTDRDVYEPRQEGAVTIRTRDVDGKPVPAEVALSVSDESVTAIQKDLAADPRQFFFGELAAYPLNVSASVQMQRYAMLIEEDGKLIDDRERELEKRRLEEQGDLEDVDSFGVAGGVPGGVVGGVVGGVPPPPPPPAQAARMAKPAAVNESITVTTAAPVALDAIQELKETTIQVHVRSDFRSTAFWKPDVVTDANGVARITLKYPEALTTWRTTARAVSAATQVGMGSTTARTNMPLIVRLQAPRFFVAGDRATVSAVINNNTDAAMSVTPSLEAEGVTMTDTHARQALDVPPHGEVRADWTVVAERAGDAKLRVSGRGSGRGDAMEKTITVYEHGVDKLIARSGKVRGDEAVIALDLPHERRATSLTVQIQPSLAVMMLDALPYLIDYPYGCTEQTMSRFLPAAIVARTMVKNGLDPEDIEGHIFGGIEREHAAATHPKGSKDLRRIDEITRRSMERLYDFQHNEGGWGWWKDGDSDEFMTAYVVWGFSIAKEGGLAVNDEAVRRAVAFLDRHLVEEEKNWAQQSWMLHAIAAWRAAAHDGTINDDERRAFENVWSHRDRLTAYSRALLALAAHDFGDARASVLVRNLEDGVIVDSGAAHWGESGFWWRWYEGPVESTSFALQALVEIDPQNKLVEPVMTWLVKNRRGAQWNNTRDTAITILALNDYLAVSGELKGEVAYTLTANGRTIATKRVSAFDVSRFTIDDVRDANEIRIRRSGDRPLYYAVEGRFISLEEPVKAAGNEIFVKREYFRLAQHPTLLKGISYDREPLLDNGFVNSGERVEVVVTIDSKNDYEYLIFEDLKPAGLEAVSLQSGQPLYAMSANRSAWVYQELRDRKVAMFIDHLPQGKWEIRYTLRAEVPGAFHALPVLGQAMYVPEIHANGDEVRLTVR